MEIKCPYREICRDYERAIKILEVTKKERMHILMISKKTDIPYRTAWRTVKRLHKIGLLHEKMMAVTMKSKLNGNYVKNIPGYKNAFYITEL